MLKIENSLDQLNDALKNNLPIYGYGEGYWYPEGILKRILGTLFNQPNKRWITLAESFTKALNVLERVPVIISLTTNPHNSPQLSVYQKYINIAKQILDHLRESSSKESIQAAMKLDREYVALLYRIEKMNGGLEPADICPEILNSLKENVVSWKHQQAILYDHLISEREIHLLQEAVRYPEFIKLLREDADLKEAFMLWTIRDKISPLTFIQYPAIQKRIVEVGLNGRIGRSGGNTLRIRREALEDGTVQKIVTFPMEGSEVNILNEAKKYTFRGNYTLSVKEILNVFRDKPIRIGNLEFLAEGITNWNNHRLGWWDEDKQDYQVIDMSKLDWWTQLPYFEILKKNEAQNKYGWHLDGVQWNAAATASRGTPNLDFERCHAYLELAIPIDQKRYAIYDFGKFADEFPSNQFETLGMLCLNVHAVVAYPDENIFYTHRQHAYHSFCLTPAEGMKLMRLIKLDILKSREKNMIYQIESENCAKWSQELLSEVLGNRVPNLFKMSLLDTEPMGWVAKVFNLIKTLPERLQTKVLTFLHLPLGAAKGTWIMENGVRVKKSLVSHEFWETAEVYLPAFLHKQKEVGVLSYTVEATTVLHLERGNFYSASSTLVETYAYFPLGILKRMRDCVKKYLVVDLNLMDPFDNQFAYQLLKRRAE